MTPQDRAERKSPPAECMIEYSCQCDDEGGWWVLIELNSLPYDAIGPFTSEEAAIRCKDDFRAEMRKCGARDIHYAGEAVN